MKQQHNTPSAWAMKFLRWFCPEDLFEGISGDLLEQFEEDVASLGAGKARRRLRWTVIRLFHPTILLRNRVKQLKYSTMDMYKSHLLVAYRSMMKHKFYSGINVLGLALAVAFVFLSFLFLQRELTYDQFHENKAEIYRLYTQSTDTVTRMATRKTAILPVPLARDIAIEVAAVRMFSRLTSTSGVISKNKVPYKEKVSFADEDFFHLFSFPIVEGNREQALSQPGKVALSKEKAAKYFGTHDPIGETLDLTLNDSTQTFVVSAVFDALANQSSLKPEVVVPFETFGMVAPSVYMDSYTYSSIESYVLMRDPDVSQGVSPVLTSAVAKHTDADSNERYEVGLQPLLSVHTDPVLIGNASYTNPQKLFIMAGLALLVLLVAVINFITLATGHALKRMKEMGMRKTLGAVKGQIRVQLVVESFFLSLFSGLVGLGLAYLSAPFFNMLLESTLEFNINPLSIVFIVGLTFFIALVAGAIQSVFMVSSKPLDALRGSSTIAGRDSVLNQVLLVLQFSFSVLLVVGTLIIRSQMNYIQNKEIGYDKERLLEVGMPGLPDEAASENFLSKIKSGLMQDPRIVDVSASMNSFKDPWTQLDILQNDESIEKIYFNRIDPGYLKAMDIELLQGSDFDASQATKSQVIVNEALVRHFGWEDPLSEQIPGKNFTKSHQIIGVVKDFHFSSLHDKIEPLILTVDSYAVAEGVVGLSTYVWPPNIYTMLVRVRPGDLAESLELVESKWEEISPDQPFNYDFVDDTLAKNYKEEKQWQRVINSASMFSLVIAWLGLIGLTRLSVQKRVKEIGIRKVLGSSVTGVTSLLSRRFLLLVAVSNIIAWPVAWWAADQWLQSFTYRVSPSIWLFLLAGVGVLLVAMSSVSFQAYRAASSNPVDALKVE